MATGKEIYDLAVTREGEEYVYGADVPLDDADYHGPWDCAEFVSWVVFQTTGKLYGCLGDADNPDPWTGEWFAEANSGKVIKVRVKQAIATVGAILLRFDRDVHHIAISDGEGGTIEAAGRNYGVCKRNAEGRGWTFGILIPEVKYNG